MAAITEELCGTQVSKSQVSSLVGRLEPELAAWRERRLSVAAYPYLVVDARHEHARVDGRVVSLGVLVVAGVRDDRRREILTVGEADTESEATYQEHFNGTERGMGQQATLPEHGAVVGGAAASGGTGANCLRGRLTTGSPEDFYSTSRT